MTARIAQHARDRLLDPLRTRRVANAYDRAARARLKRILRLILRTLRENAPALDVYGSGPALNRLWRWIANVATARGPGFLRGSAREQGETMYGYAQQLVDEILVESGVELIDTYYTTAVETAYRAGLAQAASKGGLTQRQRRVLLRSPTHVTAARALARSQPALLSGLGAKLSEEVRDAVVEGINQRLTVESIAARIEKRFGVLAHRATTIARTETVKAHAEGSLNGFLAMRFERVTVDVEWTLNVHGDAAPCPECSALSGQVFTIAAARGRIPLHPNCLAHDQAVSGPIPLGAVERKFRGDVVVIKSANRHEIAVTPNHPVLTDKGWVAAGLLDGSYHRIATGGQKRETLVDVDDYLKPTGAADLAYALLSSQRMTAREVPVAAPDFHGDGLNGHIAVIGTDAGLRIHHQPGLFEPCPHGKLRRRRLRPAESLDGRSALDLLLAAVLATPGGFVSGFGDLQSLLARHPRHADFLGFADTAPLDSMLEQDALYGGAVHAVLDGESLFGLPVQVGRDDERFVKIDSCRHVGYSGNVYNFETELGYYICNGIVVHNCQCGFLPVFDRPRDRR